MSTDEDTQTYFDTQKTVKIRLFVCVERKEEEEEEEEESTACHYFDTEG